MELQGVGQVCKPTHLSLLRNTTPSTLPLSLPVFTFEPTGHPNQNEWALTCSYIERHQTASDFKERAKYSSQVWLSRPSLFPKNIGCLVCMAALFPGLWGFRGDQGRFQLHWSVGKPTHNLTKLEFWIPPAPNVCKHAIMLAKTIV